MPKLLIVEDDPIILKGLVASFEQEHYTILTANDGEEGYLLAQQENLDIIILDLMLPKKNGETVCRELRQQGINTPIIILTSKKEEIDKVLGLQLGADDYVTKPFSIKELLARVQAVLRRSLKQEKEITEYTFDNIHIDFKKQEVYKDNQEIKFSAKEFKIMQLFIQHENEVITRETFLKEVWGYDVYPTTRTIDTFVLNLRKKIENDPSNPQHIHTMHKSGYKFVK